MSSRKRILNAWKWVGLLKIMRHVLVYLCVWSDLCLEGNICAISRLFLAGINSRNLLYSKKFTDIWIKRVFSCVYSSLALLAPLQLLEFPALFFCPDKSDNSLLVLQGFCAAGRVVMDGESLGILALVEIIQIYLRQIARGSTGSGRSWIYSASGINESHMSVWSRGF